MMPGVLPGTHLALVNTAAPAEDDALAIAPAHVPFGDFVAVPRRDRCCRHWQALRNRCLRKRDKQCL